MKRAALLGAVALLVGLVPSAAAQDSDNTTVTVNVNPTTALDINPTSLSFTGVQPKSFEAGSDNGFPGVEIENSGSKNISEVSLNTTNNADNPFGTGLQGEYNAGNLLQARPEQGLPETTSIDASPTGNSDQSGYHYVSRIDFNETRELSYIKTPQTEGELGSPDFVWRYGRFRSGNESFFWAIRGTTASGGDSNICDGADNAGLLRVGTLSHTDERKGTTDFTDSNIENFVNVSVSESGGSTPYGRANQVELNTSTGNTTYDVLSYCDDTGTVDSNGADGQTYLTRTRFDLNPFDTTNLPNTEGLTVSGDTALQKVTDAPTNNEAQQLQPGEHYTLFMGVEAGRGIAAGQLQQGTLQLIGTAAS